MSDAVPYKSLDAHLLRAILAQIWADGGPAPRAGKHRAKPAQLRYSEAMIETMARGSARRHRLGPSAQASIQMVSADTGTGKTMAFGVPALTAAALGHRVAIATANLALQQQYLGTAKQPGDLTLIANWLEAIGQRRPKIARRMGAQAFVSASALEDLLADAERKLDKESRGQLQTMLDFAYAANAGANSGLLDDALATFGGHMPPDVGRALVCLGADSDSADCAAYDRHIVQAREADCLLVSHHYLLVAAAYQRGRLIEDAQIETLVIDEADRLQEVAASVFRFDASLTRATAALSKFAGSRAQSARSALMQLTTFAKAIARPGERVASMAGQPDAQREQCAELAQAAAEAVEALLATSSASRRRTAVQTESLTHLQFVLRRFARSLASRDTGYETAISYSPSVNLPSITCVPLNPARRIAGVWSDRADKDDGGPTPVCSVILTSATLAANGSYDQPAERFLPLCRATGLAPYARQTQFRQLAVCEHDLWLHLEPERFGRLRFVLADPAVPPPFGVFRAESEQDVDYDDRWLSYAAMMIREARRIGGRTLVLVGSYRDAEAIGARLAAQGIGAIVQRRGQASAELEAAFTDDENSIWLSPTSWEGLNLPGMISHVVIARLPFAKPDPVAAAMLANATQLSDRQAANILMGRAVADALRMYRQGIGRAIRRATDHATIWVADPRVPLHESSTLAARHLGAIVQDPLVRYKPVFHTAVPGRFRAAVINAAVLLESGKIIS